MTCRRESAADRECAAIEVARRRRRFCCSIPSMGATTCCAARARAAKVVSVGVAPLDLTEKRPGRRGGMRRSSTLAVSRGEGQARRRGACCLSRQMPCGSREYVSCKSEFVRRVNSMCLERDAGARATFTWRVAGERAVFRNLQRPDAADGNNFRCALLTMSSVIKCVHSCRGSCTSTCQQLAVDRSQDVRKSNIAKTR